ncbi:MAG: Gfo/Idh/MocA family oxidoreductase [Krumholzibacteria bacterium]|nr:Gfo/Idh/MocA family oxidoreductase [Candidatus Krumholzibacteria bacterium]
MSPSVTRRDFIRTAALAAGAVSAGALGAWSLVGCGSGPYARPRRNMCGFAVPPLERIRIGFVGLGMRGPGAVERLAKIRDVDVVALCDIRPTGVAESQEILRAHGRPPARGFTAGPEDWRNLCQLDLDLVYICTPWEWHVPMAVGAMRAGKHAAVEVPAALDLDGCWELVETSERTGRHCMMLENCCYDFFELMTLNMVRQGVFGELTHAEGAYIHSLVDYMQPKDGQEIYQGNWRLKHNLERNGNLYPTHGLGPVAQCLDVNRGNRFTWLTSMSSQEAAFTEHARQSGNLQFADLPTYRGDMNTTLIQCARGETVMVQHDTSTPRAYSRIHLLQGSLGMARKWPKTGVCLHEKGHRWLDDEEFRELEAQYRHPLVATIGDIARKVGGHGGMDFIMDYRLAYCLKNGLPLDQDVYDAAAWSAVVPLSCASVARRSGSVAVPDFTRGRWETNAPLGIVDVDPARLPVLATAAAAGQLEVE